LTNRDKVRDRKVTPLDNRLNHPRSDFPTSRVKDRKNGEIERMDPSVKSKRPR
jgi:hypothetical protein